VEEVAAVGVAVRTGLAKAEVKAGAKPVAEGVVRAVDTVIPGDPVLVAAAQGLVASPARVAAVQVGVAVTTGHQSLGTLESFCLLPGPRCR
jgi:hypothetical protein